MHGCSSVSGWGDLKQRKIEENGIMAESIEFTVLQSLKQL